MKMIHLTPAAILCVLASVVFLIICLTYETPPHVGDVYCDYDKGETWNAPMQASPYVMIMKVIEIKDDKVCVDQTTVWENATYSHAANQWMPITFLTVGSAKRIKEVSK